MKGGTLRGLPSVDWKGEEDTVTSGQVPGVGVLLCCTASPLPLGQASEETFLVGSTVLLGLTTQCLPIPC